MTVTDAISVRFLLTNGEVALLVHCAVNITVVLARATLGILWQLAICTLELNITSGHAELLGGDTDLLCYSWTCQI